MSQPKQPDKRRVTGKMFDVANISQPMPFQGKPSSVTPANTSLLSPNTQTPPAKNGFTVDNLRLPEEPQKPELENKK